MFVNSKTIFEKKHITAVQYHYLYQDHSQKLRAKMFDHQSNISQCASHFEDYICMGFALCGMGENT